MVNTVARFERFILRFIFPNILAKGYVETKILANKPKTFKQLEQNILYEINEISSEMCENITKKVHKITHICKGNRCGYCISDINVDIKYGIHSH